MRKTRMTPWPARFVKAIIAASFSRGTGPLLEGP
jgi:hypothetical protein